MRAVIQRVRQASVTIHGAETAAIGQGLLVLAGVEEGDTARDIDWLAAKTVAMRIFADEEGKMNRSVRDIDGDVLVVSQFTLYGDARKGRRPSFVDAARPEKANQLYESFCAEVRGQGIRVETGRFQKHMDGHAGRWHHRRANIGRGRPGGSIKTAFSCWAPR